MLEHFAPWDNLIVNTDNYGTVTLQNIEAIISPERRDRMSIHPHSHADTYFIFCVGQDIRKINAFKANMAHHKISIKPLLGMYKGQSEQSFIANMTNFRLIEPWLIEEESILHIHNFDARDVPDATLIFLKKGEKIELGKMRPVDRDLALARDAWTYDPTYQTYFVTDQMV